MSTYWVKYKGTRFPIRRGETILGRSPYCSIVISDDLVSREHCALRLTSDGLTVTDLNSTNGVRVNGNLIKGPTGVQPGDVLTVGTALLEVMRMDTMRSRARTTTRSDLEIPKQLENTVTLTQENSLELIETLLKNASESGRAARVASVIRKAIDELVSKLTQTGSAPSPTRERLKTSIEELRNWFADGTFDDWANDAKAKLDDLAGC
ncbi:MAG: FHA domain-containing protein [Polyangiaceae bacterium]|nr:FHA domain-containing protein [Myxococcales bacterium]MCB9588137.1 FHA domain-containing protein [Polyangiaceae bacterium]